MEGHYEPKVLVAALPGMTNANPHLLGSETYYIAINDGGKVVGCGGWTPERPGQGGIEPGLAHIRHFATHPDAIGQGIGRALFTACLEAARKAGINRFECYSSLNGEGFYAALGFQTVERVEVNMGEGLTFPSLLMTRDI